MVATVSIIVPSHNRAALLRQTLESVRAQTCRDFECIVVDDASTDNTASVVREFASGDSRFIYIKLDQPSGAQVARNTGIEHAIAEYVILLDSDDLLADFCIEQRLSVMRDQPELDFAVFPCEIFLNQPGDKALLWNVPTDQGDLDRFLRNDVPWQTTSPIWRKSSLQRVGPWDIDVPVAQDWEFHIRAILKGLKYTCTGQPDHYWRMPDAERESIGKSGFKPPLLRARVLVNEKVLNRFRAIRNLTDLETKRFAGLFWLSAERIAQRISRVEGRQVWSKAHDLGLISRRQRRQGNSYLFWHRFEKLRAPLRKRLERKWPTEFFIVRSATYLNSPVPKSAEVHA